MRGLAAHISAKYTRAARYRLNNDGSHSPASMVEAMFVCKKKFCPEDMLAVACKSSPAFPQEATRKDITAKCDLKRHVDMNAWLWQEGITRNPEMHAKTRIQQGAMRSKKRKGIVSDEPDKRTGMKANAMQGS